MQTTLATGIKNRKDIELKRATIKDESVVVNILCESFKSDPLISWMLEKSKNPAKLKVMMTYLFRQSLKIGKVFLTEDETATAMWRCEKKDIINMEFILRNVDFLIKIGFRSVFRIISSENFTYKQYPKQKRYCHLLMIAVLPESRGKGYASVLMNPVLNDMESKSRPVYLETANIKNISIYAKKGFSIYNIWRKYGVKLYYLKRV